MSGEILDLQRFTAGLHTRIIESGGTSQDEEREKAGGHCHAPLFVGSSRAGRGGGRSARRLDPRDRACLPRQHLLHRSPAPATPRRRDARPRAPRGGPPPALGPDAQERLAGLLRAQPDATLEQLRQRGGSTCSLKTLWLALRRRHLTYKKKSLHASQRDRPEVQKKRRAFRREVRPIEPKRLVFVDETGVTTAMTPAYAWAER